MRGQISQVFVYIMTGIVILAVFAFGFRAILSITSTADYVECLQFKQNLEKRLNSDKYYGTVDEISMRSACEYSQICFTGNLVDSNDLVNLNPQDFVIINKGSSKHNVFFRNVVSEDAFYIEGTMVENPFCVDLTTGILKIKAEGKGQTVLLSEV